MYFMTLPPAAGREQSKVACSSEQSLRGCCLWCLKAWAATGSGRTLGGAQMWLPAGWSVASHVVHSLCCVGRDAIRGWQHLTLLALPWQHTRCLKLLLEEQLDNLWHCLAPTRSCSARTSPTCAGAEAPAPIRSAATKSCTLLAARWHSEHLRGTTCTAMLPLEMCPSQLGRQRRRTQGFTAAVWRSPAFSTTSSATYGWRWQEVGLGTLGTQPAGRNHSLGSENCGLCVLCLFVLTKGAFPKLCIFQGRSATSCQFESHSMCSSD